MIIKSMKAIFLPLALSCAALPGAAYAGTSTASGAAALGVVSQCMVAGSNVDLGAYTTSDTWDTVATALGKTDSAGTYWVGTRGQEYLTYGSVTCASGTPYTLNISGTAPSAVVGARGIKLTVNGKVMVLLMAVRKVGSATINPPGPLDVASFGQFMTNNNYLSATGTGAPQAVLGSAIVANNATYSTALLTDKLNTPGAYTDSLTYTLNF